MKLIGIAILWFVLQIIANICEWTSDPTSVTTLPGLLESLTSITWDSIGNVWNSLGALWNMFWFNYGYLSGDFLIFKYILWCISLGFIFSIGLAIRGTSSG